MKKIFIIALFCITNITLAETPHEMVDRFLLKVDESPQEAVNEIIKNGPLASPRLQMNIGSLGNQIALAIQVSGNKIDTPPEKLKEQDISNYMKHMVYVQKYEVMPITWYFSFYKPHNEWILQSIYLNTDLPNL